MSGLHHFGPHRRAMSAMDLLIVIAIIGILLALLLPAISSARASARRAQCMSNLKQLALANIMHENVKKQLIGYRTTITRKDNKKETVGYLPQLFPYIEQANLNEAMLSGKDYKVGIPLAVCASDVAAEKLALSYGVSAGRPDDANGDGKPDRDPPDSKEYAVFHDHSEGVTKVAMRLKDIKGGASNTLMLAENTDLISWDLAKFEYQQGIVFLDETAKKRLLPNEGRGGKLDYAHARPSSYHPGGFNSAYIDGHVEFMSDWDFEFDDFKTLLTPADD